MNLEYAVERLYESGWSKSAAERNLDHLPDGRAFPSLEAIRNQFARAGLELSIKRNLMFGCYHASWEPSGDAPESEDSRGTVIGACEREAAVYALAQLRETHSAQQFAAV
jgi:hypothetical protein